MPSGHSDSSYSSSSSSSSSSGYSSGSSGSSFGSYSSDYTDNVYRYRYDRDVYDYDRYDGFRDYSNRGYSGGNSRFNSIVFFIAVGVLFAAILLGVNIHEELNKNSNPNYGMIIEDVSYSTNGNNDGKTTSVYTTVNTSETYSTQSRQKQSPGYGIVHDSIYVAEIGRTCRYDKASDNYYDEVTDCYFWLNDRVDPPVWQYWYEGISSDFGNYGWMEYSYNEGKWYIESSDDHWTALPDKYDTSKLWHLDKPKAGKYAGKNSIYVPALQRDCEFVESLNNYYDPATGTLFYYDSYLRPSEWVYWFKDYGWMYYDKDSDSWYRLAETVDGKFLEKVPSEWHDKKLWHFG